MINNNLEYKKLVASSTGVSTYQNDVLKTAKEIIVRNGYGASIPLTGGTNIWCHLTSTSYYTDATYSFDASKGIVKVTVNASVGWSSQAAYIKDIFYR